jgi:hypothetical protein
MRDPCPLRSCFRRDVSCEPHISSSNDLQDSLKEEPNVLSMVSRDISETSRPQERGLGEDVGPRLRRFDNVLTAATRDALDPAPEIIPVPHVLCIFCPNRLPGSDFVLAPC